MIEYVVRKGNLLYEVAKFEFTSEPVAIYRFTARGCTCPSRSSSCKHVKILNTWKAAGEPWGTIYNDKAEAIGNIF